MNKEFKTFPWPMLPQMFDLSIDQPLEIGQNQASASGENKNYRPNSPKGGGSDRLEGREEEYESSQQRGRTPCWRLHDQNNHSQSQDLHHASYARGPIKNLNAHRRRHYTPSKQNSIKGVKTLFHKNFDEETPLV